jgi:ParB-like chromosome segregation protein Spo0J
LHHNLRLVTHYVPIGSLKPPRRALRKHGKRQLQMLKASVSEFGILKPILVDLDGHIVAGYGVWLAAKELGGQQVPTIELEHLTPREAAALCDRRQPDACARDL